MRTHILSILIILSLLAPLGAQGSEPAPLPALAELTAHLANSHQTAINGDGEIVLPLEEDIPLSLVPGNDGEDLEKLRREMKRSFGVETLLFLPKEDYTDPDNLMLNIYNILRNVSSLEGADYYSHTRERRRTLFHRFFAISHRESMEPLTDPVYRELPPREKFIIFQEDATFGESVHRMEYSVNNGSITLSMKNLDKLYKLFIKVADPEELLMVARVIPVREGVLFYGLCQAAGHGIPGMKERTTKSLANRVKALFEWFTRRSVEL